MSANVVCNSLLMLFQLVSIVALCVGALRNLFHRRGKQIDLVSLLREAREEKIPYPKDLGSL